jgi:hypothetical protein
MKYRWLTVGDQDRCIHKMCFLGLWQLEIKEKQWRGDKMWVTCKVYMWSDVDHGYLPVSMIEDKPRRYKLTGKNCVRFLENWYAENVLMPQLMMGTDDIT